MNTETLWKVKEVRNKEIHRMIPLIGNAHTRQIYINRK